MKKMILLMVVSFMHLNGVLAETICANTQNDTLSIPLKKIYSLIDKDDKTTASQIVLTLNKNEKDIKKDTFLTYCQARSIGQEGDMPIKPIIINIDQGVSGTVTSEMAVSKSRLIIDDSSSDALNMNHNGLNMEYGAGLFFRHNTRSRIYFQTGLDFMVQERRYQLRGSLNSMEFDENIKERYYSFKVPAKVGVWVCPFRLYSGLTVTQGVGGKTNLTELIPTTRQSFNPLTIGGELGMGVDVKRWTFDLAYERDLKQYKGELFLLGQDISPRLGNHFKLSIGMKFHKRR